MGVIQGDDLANISSISNAVLKYIEFEVLHLLGIVRKSYFMPAFIRCRIIRITNDVKAYEIEKSIIDAKTDNVLAIIIVIVAILLLAIGYKRLSDKK